jgi:hypothetical protein
MQVHTCGKALVGAIGTGWGTAVGFNGLLISWLSGDGLWIFKYPNISQFTTDMTQ